LAGIVRLDRDAAHCRWPRARTPASAGAELSARAGDRRSEKLLGDDLFPSAKRPSGEISQAQLAGRAVNGETGREGAEPAVTRFSRLTTSYTFRSCDTSLSCSTQRFSPCWSAAQLHPNPVSRTGMTSFPGIQFTSAVPTPAPTHARFAPTKLGPQ